MIIGLFLYYSVIAFIFTCGAIGVLVGLLALILCMSLITKRGGDMAKGVSDFGGAAGGWTRRSTTLMIGRSD
jgi:hypothetical protein